MPRVRPRSSSRAAWQIASAAKVFHSSLHSSPSCGPRMDAQLICAPYRPPRAAPRTIIPSQKRRFNIFARKRSRFILSPRGDLRAHSIALLDSRGLVATLSFVSPSSARERIFPLLLSSHALPLDQRRAAECWRAKQLSGSPAERAHAEYERAQRE
jgi:hypothetical protein